MSHYIYIVLTRTNTMFSRLIQFAKNDDYTHAAISFDKTLDQMYSFGRKNVRNPFIGRFNQESLDKGVYKLHKVLPGAIVEFEVSKAQYECARKLINHFVENSEIYKYNYIGLIKSVFNMSGCYDHRFLCSEFTYHILKESGVVDLKISRNLVRPQNLYELHGRLIYQGDLKVYEGRSQQMKGFERMNVIYEG